VFLEIDFLSRGIVSRRVALNSGVEYALISLMILILFGVFYYSFL
jgi:hypothetical protein